MGNPGQTKKIPIVRWFGLRHVAQIFYTHFFTKFGTKSAFVYYGWSKKSKIAYSKGWAIMSKQKRTGFSIGLLKVNIFSHILACLLYGKFK